VDEIEEIAQTIERLQGALEDLTVRGLRAAGPQDLARLRALHEEFQRIGADHLAGRVAALVKAVASNDRAAAAALLRAQTSLRLFDRVLTLEVAAAALHHLITPMESEATA
jgi:hypothetical protein